MKIADILRTLEQWAPPALQEDYDNSGMIVGDASREVNAVLVSLDCTEAVVDEAIAQGCGLIISHHPIVFSGLKKITGRNYVERTVLKAIKNDIALYAIHTNLDHVATGVNRMICDKLGLADVRILRPIKDQLQKLVVYAPRNQAEAVRNAMFTAGAGVIGNYSECSFNLTGEGTFKGNENTNPFAGEKNQRHTEVETRIEVILPAYASGQVINAMTEAHPYEEVAYDLYTLANKWPVTGAGMIGQLTENEEETGFLKRVKTVFGAGIVRHTALLGKPVKTVAVCGGSGRFLLPDARAAGADVFITSDFKYHEYFDAEGKIVIADIGHYESERFTIDLVAGFLKEKFNTFAVRLSEVDTNPVKYL